MSGLMGLWGLLFILAGTFLAIGEATTVGWALAGLAFLIGTVSLGFAAVLEQLVKITRTLKK
jgi:hypothetical protein